MPSPFDFASSPFRVGGLAFVILIACASVPAQSAETVLYSFKGGSDGVDPLAGVVADAAGNLYGTTASGGDGGNGCRNGGGSCGTVFELAPDGTETVLHAFVGGCDGATPFGKLFADKSGNFYGTTQNGGVCNSDEGNGTIFKIAPDGTESVFYAFPGGSGGENPAAGLAADKKGNLYGTANGGDSTACNGGCGVVFEITPEGKEKFVYSFQAGNDGDGPSGPVIVDKAGNVYGTTVAGGGSGCNGGGCGTVFKIAPGGGGTVLYAFQGGTDGRLPQTGVIEDNAGNLYGTTATGAGGNGNYGTVFKVTSGGAESVLYAFQGGEDGYNPEAGLIRDKTGNLYGTTNFGGSTGCDGTGCGVAFKLAPDGTETVLYRFDRVAFGRHPEAPLLMGKHNVLYGTTAIGGAGRDGVVFSVTAK